MKIQRIIKLAMAFMFAAYWGGAIQPLLANASGEKGNGGDIRLIENNYYSLDLIEAGVHLNPYDSSGATYSKRIDEWVDLYFGLQEFAGIRQKLKQKLGDLESIDMIAAHSILLSASNYVWTFIYDQNLVEIYDEFSNVKGENIQVGIRRNRSIQVHANLYHRLNDDNKLAFVLHELINALSKDTLVLVENTKARELTGLLFREDMMTKQTALLRKVICNTIPCVPLNQSSPSSVFISSTLFANQTKALETISLPQIYFELARWWDDAASAYSLAGSGQLVGIETYNSPGFDQSLCEQVWDLSDLKTLKELKTSDFRLSFMVSLARSSTSYSYNFYDHDYTYKAWLSCGTMCLRDMVDSSRYVYDEKLLHRSVIQAGVTEVVTEKVCISKDRVGNCKSYRSEQKEVIFPKKEIFMNECVRAVKSMVTENLQYLQKSVVAR